MKCCFCGAHVKKEFPEQILAICQECAEELNQFENVLLSFLEKGGGFHANHNNVQSVG
jgi:hypothetical protein